MKTAAVMMFLLLIGGVLMAQSPVPTPMPMSEFWKRYPMPTSTPNPSQLQQGSPPIPSPQPSPMPSLTPSAVPTLSEFQRNPHIGPFAVPSPGATTVPDYRGKQ